MSVHMKKHPIKVDAEIYLHTEKFNESFVVAENRLKLVLNLLREFSFDTSSSQISWEEIAKERISKFTKQGIALRGARKRLSLSQKELAAKLNIDVSNLSKMEKGKRPIGKKMAQRLARVLDIHYKVFL